MEISTRRLGQYTSELNWIIMALSGIQPEVSRNRVVSSTIHEVLERLEYLNNNITKVKEKGKKNV